MTRHEDGQGPKPRKRRPRAPRIIPVPESMRDPRHNPAAAEAEIRAALKSGGRPLTVDEAWAWFGHVDLQVFETIIDPQTGEARNPERAERDKDGRLRFRSLHEKHGPGRLKMRSEERALEESETDFARLLNATEQTCRLLANYHAASRFGVAKRSRQAAEVADKVCALYDAMAFPARNRASAIVRTLAREGHPISVQRVRQILHARRRDKHER